ncbi:MAG: hypothetical protein JXM72_02885, partial [Deltaproteobacteria bacterium]|nr:hypothetical protein [Deltaproteobacteria bacterium]
MFVSLLMFMGVSLTLVMGSLYWMLSRSMDKEFTNEIRARQAEINMILHEQFTMIGSKLNEFSLDNALRVNLMLGMDQRLEERLSIRSTFPEGTDAILLDHRTKRLYPHDRDISPELANHLQTMAEADTIQCERFVSLDESSLVSIWSVPVVRRDERLGTVFAVYDLARDSTLWQRIVGNDAEDIYLHMDEELVNLKTLDVLDNPAGSAMFFDTGNKNPPGMFVVSLKDFPTLSYVVSSKPLSD